MKLSQSAPSASAASAQRGFTLVDLLATITVLALLTLSFLPARAATRTKSDAIVCLSHLHQLMGAVLMYSPDNHDFFPPNPDDGNTVPGHNWCGGRAGVGASGEFNSDMLKDPARCSLAPYVHSDVSVFHCPADARLGQYQGADPTKRGTLAASARSVSMNGGVGTVCSCFNQGGGHCDQPTLSVNGPWLDGNHGHSRNSPYATFGRTSDFSKVRPAQIFTILDEDANSINDGALGVAAAVPAVVDFPASRHDHGAGISFADGHVELHKWKTDLFVLTGGRMSTTAANPDWQWERTHATVKLY